jgi:hypothetical protein
MVLNYVKVNECGFILQNVYTCLMITLVKLNKINQVINSQIAGLL